MKSVLMGASHHLKRSHGPPVRSRLTQVRFLPALVRFRLHYEPGLGPLRQWGQEDACGEEGQEEERLGKEECHLGMSERVENLEEMRHLRDWRDWRHRGQEKRRFAMSELVENFEEMGHLGHLRHLGY